MFENKTNITDTVENKKKFVLEINNQVKVSSKYVILIIGILITSDIISFLCPE